MSEKQDPLELLRAAWQEQSADVPGELLEAQDSATRETVRYLREAWRRSAVEQPVAVPPELLRPAKGAGPLRSVSPWVAVLSASAAAWLLWLAPLGSLERSDPGDRVAELDPAVPDSQAPQFRGRARHVADADFTARDDGIELRSGSVRLILITPGADSTGSSEDR